MDMELEIEDGVCKQVPEACVERPADLIPQRLTIANVVAFTMTLGESILKGNPRVDQEEADRRGSMLTVTKKKIFDYMLRDNDIMVKRIIREWNNAFPERPLMMDDISPAEINKYLMRKHTRLERESIDPATQPKRGKKSSPFALPR